RGDVGAELAQICDALLDRDADRAGRVVDDHVVDLGRDGLGDRLEVLDLIGRGSIRAAGVDVDLRGALVDRAACLGRVLLGRVRDRRALVAVGDRAGDRVADDHRVLEAAHPMPFSKVRLTSSISSPGSVRETFSAKPNVAKASPSKTRTPAKATFSFLRTTLTRSLIPASPRASSRGARPACRPPSEGLG